MGGQPKTITQQTVQDKAPWTPAQPYYLDIYGKTQDALNATNKNPFTGDFIAQGTPDATAGLDALRSTAMNSPIPGQLTDYNRMLSGMARGDYLDPNKNPFISAVANAAIKPVTQTFQNTVLPGITDQAIMQGAYGGARQDVSQERASSDLEKQIGDITSNIFYQNYANERANQLQLPTMMGQASDIAQIPGQTLLGVDQQARMLQQLALDNQRQQFMEQKTAPWYGLGEAAQIMSQGGFSTLTGNSTMTNPNYVDPMTSILKSALGGASSIAGLGGQGGFGWWGKPLTAAA
jgi:hypothetical protein